MFEIRSQHKGLAKEGNFSALTVNFILDRIKSKHVFAHFLVGSLALNGY